MEYEYDKQMIGLLIAWTRKKLNHQLGGTQYTQVGLISNKGKTYLENCSICQTPCQKDKICSKNILVEIEKGIAYKKECYYVGLIENLGYEYRCDQQIINEINMIETKLIDVLSTYYLPKINEVNQLIDLAMTKYKSIFYFSDLLKIYKSIVLFMLKKERIIEFDDEFLQLFVDHGHSNIQELAAILIFIKYEEVYESEPVLSILQNKQKPHLYAYRYRIIANFKTHTLTASNKIFNQILQEDYSQLSSYNQFALHNNLALLHLNSYNIQEAIHHLNKCRKLAEDETNQFPPHLLLSLQNRLGIALYMAKDFEHSIEYFLQLYQTNITLVSGNIILLYHMLEKQNRVAELKTLLKKEYYNKIEHPQIKAIFRYYELKYSKPMSKELANELEDFIISDMDLKNTIHSDIVLEELESCINITKNYKNHYLYTLKLKG